ERLLADTLVAAFGDRHRQILAGRSHRLQKSVRGQIAADLAHLVAEHRIVFDPMAVAIDDRMVDFRPDLFRGHMRAHGWSPEKVGITLSKVGVFRAVRHQRSPPSPASGATPPIICAGSLWRRETLSSCGGRNYLEQRMPDDDWRALAATRHNAVPSMSLKH